MTNTAPDLTNVDWQGLGDMMRAAGQTPIPADWTATAKELYGGYYAIIETVPELQSILMKAVNEKWGENKFLYELQQTNWYRSTTAAARQWDLNSQRDPASAQQQIDAKATEINNVVDTLGVQLDVATRQRIARDSLRNGWSEVQTQQAIAGEAAKTQAGVSQLSSGFIGTQLRQSAKQYGVSLSENTLNDWTSRIATGRDTTAGFQNYVKQTAKTLYPTIGTQLDSGLTFEQVVDPYRQTAARILEVNPETVDFADPKWSAALTFTTPKGEQRPMNFTEWGTYLRSNRSFGYEYTSEARTRAYQVAQGLANMFGRA